MAYSNAFYGSDKPGATRILFPNGDVDPWSAMGVQHAPTRAEPTLMVSGASHHFWTHPSLPTDQAEVVEARQVIWYQVSYFSILFKLMHWPLLRRRLISNLASILVLRCRWTVGLGRTQISYRLASNSVCVEELVKEKHVEAVVFRCYYILYIYIYMC